MSTRVLLISAIVVTLMSCASRPYYETAPAKPQNLSPATGADVIINADTRFVWQASERAVDYDFHIFDRSTGDIKKYYRYALKPADICVEDECSLTVSVALPYLEDHAWRVRAGNGVGNSDWSRSLFNMVNSGVGPGKSSNAAVPVPMSPMGGELVGSDMIQFSWQPSPTATTYDFHLFNRLDGSLAQELRSLPASTVCQGSEQCQIAREMSLPAGKGHAWRVRAGNENGYSEWTRIEFTVIAPP